MSEVLILPVVRIERNNLDFVEQRDREWNARFAECRHPPHRTRPLLVINNKKRTDKTIDRIIRPSAI